MMRSAERSGLNQAELRPVEPSDAPDTGYLESLVSRQRWKDRWDPPCQHRLTRPRRADHESVVTPGRGDLKRPARASVAYDICQVGALRFLPGVAPSALHPAYPSCPESAGDLCI